jgi:hypothetical protein
MFDGIPTDDPSAEAYAGARRYYGKDLVDYYVKARVNGDCGDWVFGCEFPHHTTLDQNFTPEQSKAYIDLGYHIVRNEIEGSSEDPIQKDMMYCSAKGAHDP